MPRTGVFICRPGHLRSVSRISPPVGKLDSGLRNVSKTPPQRADELLPCPLVTRQGTGFRFPRVPAGSLLGFSAQRLLEKGSKGEKKRQGDVSRDRVAIFHREARGFHTSPVRDISHWFCFLGRINKSRLLSLLRCISHSLMMVESVLLTSGL